MSEMYGSDAFSPVQIAERIENVGVTKARLPLLQMVMLGVLAGAFIGLGALYYTLVISDAQLSFAVARLTGALCFTLGLLLVVVAGAELFTGNNLIAMAWADGKVSSGEVLRNWVVVCLANFAGAAGLAMLVFLSGHFDLGGGAVARTYLTIAVAKSTLPLSELFFRGVLCNVLVCMAVWMAMAGRSVTDRFVAIVLPVSAFVAAGFEHSIANMFFLPAALLITGSGVSIPGAEAITMAAMLRNLVTVIAGNIVGGSVLVALVYHVIYRRKAGG
jgi:formate transporter